jgi:hypothetical protein
VVEKNRHGLPRRIDPDIKREVRRRAGFGCVKCGLAFGTYHHFAPRFKDAHEHRAEGIVFMCRNHHGDADDGRMSEEEVRHYNAHPKPLEDGFSFGAFGMRADRPILHIGQVKAVDTLNFLRVHGRPILSVSPPEIAGGPFRFNADLVDRSGNPILKIMDNEWVAYTGKCDMITRKRTIKIWDAERKIDLVVRTEAPNDFFVDRINMQTDGYSIVCRGGDFTITTPDGKKVANYSGLTVLGALSAIDINKDTIIVGVNSD